VAIVDKLAPNEAAPKAGTLDARGEVRRGEVSG